MGSILENVVSVTNLSLKEYYFFENSSLNEILSSFSDNEIQKSKKFNKFINLLLLTSTKIKGNNRYVGEYSVTTLFGKTFTVNVIHMDNSLHLSTQGFEIKKYETFFKRDITFCRLLKEWYSLYILRKMMCRNKRYSSDEIITTSILLQHQSLTMRVFLDENTGE